jgi:sulfur-oxidizing protein SoxZ
MAWLARIAMPRSAKRGERVEIRTIIRHVMETGFRHDHLGRIVPRDIIASFVCRYAGDEVCRIELFPAIAANPSFAFDLIASASGDVIFTWTDDRGVSQSHTQRLDVS